MRKLLHTVIAVAALSAWISDAAPQAPRDSNSDPDKRPPAVERGTAGAGATAPEDPAARARIRAEGAAGGTGARASPDNGANAGAGPHLHRNIKRAPRGPAQPEPEWPLETEKK